MKKAEKFVKYIRKLPGQPESDTTFLDLFRELVTEIGNALGYVRMVRSGGLRFISDAVKFVPDLTGDVRFGEMATNAELRDCTIAAATNLDAVLTDLKSKFSEGSDYFQMLEDVFYEVCIRRALPGPPRSVCVWLGGFGTGQHQCLCWGPPMPFPLQGGGVGRHALGGVGASQSLRWFLHSPHCLPGSTRFVTA